MATTSHLTRFLSLHVSVVQVHLTSRTEPLTELLRDRDGSMPAARAPDGDREIRFALTLVARERVSEELTQVREQLFGLRPLQNVARHVRIEPGLGSELFNEVWVRQVTKVEHQVRFGGKPVLESEADNPDDHVAPRAAAGQVIEKCSLQVVHREASRVDDAGRFGAERRKTGALPLDATQEITRGSQGVRPPRLAVAPNEDLIRSVEEEDLDGVPGLSKRAHRGLGALQERSISDVDA